MWLTHVITLMTQVLVVEADSSVGDQALALAAESSNDLQPQEAGMYIYNYK